MRWRKRPGRDVGMVGDVSDHKQGMLLDAVIKLIQGRSKINIQMNSHVECIR